MPRLVPCTRVDIASTVLILFHHMCPKQLTKGQQATSDLHLPSLWFCVLRTRGNAAVYF